MKIKNFKFRARSKVITALTRKTPVFWDVTPWNLIEIYRQLDTLSASIFRVEEWAYLLPQYWSSRFFRKAGIFESDYTPSYPQKRWRFKCIVTQYSPHSATSYYFGPNIPFSTPPLTLSIYSLSSGWQKSEAQRTTRKTAAFSLLQHIQANEASAVLPPYVLSTQEAKNKKVLFPQTVGLVDSTNFRYKYA
jgi:hypothetical protein